MRVDPASGRIEIGGTGRLTAVLGAVLAFGGVWLLDALLAGGHGIMAGDRPAGPRDAWLPALLILAGVAIAGYRSRTWIEVGSRSRITRSRWWWRSSEKREALGEPARVTLRSERRSNGEHSQVVHPVALVTATGQHELASPRNELRARAAAEAVARIFHVPLHDLRGEDELVRRPEDLDRSIVETAGRSEAASPPERCRVRVEREGTAVTIRVPAPHAWLLVLALLPALAPACFFAFLWLPILFGQGLGRGTSVPGLLFWVGLPALVCGVPLWLVARAGRSGGLTPARIRVERGAVSVGRRRFAAREVEELEVAGTSAFARHLRIGGDAGTVRVGRGLSPEELRYLRGTILGSLA